MSDILKWLCLVATCLDYNVLREEESTNYSMSSVRPPIAITQYFGDQYISQNYEVKLTYDLLLLFCQRQMTAAVTVRNNNNFSMPNNH